MFTFDQKMGTIASMAKRKGLKLKVNKCQGRDWKTGASNTYILSRGSYILDRCQDLGWIREMINNAPAPK